MLMDYPCNCKEMIWMMEHNQVFKKQDNRLMLTWTELDREKNKGINIEQFGVVIHYCMFCGKEINNL